MVFSTNIDDVWGYRGLHREILDGSHGTFVLYFTHSEKEHTMQNHFFIDFKNTLKFELFAWTCKDHCYVDEKTE